MIIPVRYVTMNWMISAVILTHNNEDSIGRTLASVSWCDERIVMDDMSTDTTVDIAKKHGAVVYKRDLLDDFAAQRNVALAKTKGEWVLFVDSDEVIPSELAREIQSSMTDTHSTIAGYFCKRTDVMWGRELRHGETTHVMLLRLAKKNAGVWRGRINEIWDIQGKTEIFHTPILHFPHPNVAQFLSEINRYSTIRARQLHEKGIRTNLFEIIAYPVGKFFLNYVWRLGILDGMPGAASAILMSFHSFLVRAKLWIKV